MEIKKYEFELYEKVRMSGRTNMFHLTNVAALSGLSKEKILAIMKNYLELIEKFPEVGK
jgi:hypothetical protein